MNAFLDQERVEKASKRKSLRASVRRFVRRYIPLFQWVWEYEWRFLGPDVRGGLTLGLIVSSQSMAHASIAHVDIISGPYSCIWPTLIYACIGTSKHMSVGTGAMMALLTGDHVQHLETLEERTMVASQISFMCGLIMVLMAILNMSFLVRFISRAALSGFVTGAAFIIVVSQGKELVGLHEVQSGFDFFLNSFYLIQSLPHLSVEVSLVGVSVLLFLKCMARYKAQLGSLADFKELIAIFVTTLYSWGRDGALPHIGQVPQGLPRMAWPQGLTVSQMMHLLPTAAMMAIMCFVSSYAAAQKMALRDSYTVSPNKELASMGLANFIGSFFGAFPVQGGLSRTALAYGSGVKTQLAGVVSAVVVAGILSVLTPTMFYIPKTALAAIIISAATHLTDFKMVVWLYQLETSWLRRKDMAVWLSAFGGTLLFGILQGVVLSAVLSIILLIYSISVPPCYAMGRLTHGQWRALHYWPRMAHTVPGLLVIGIDGPLIFANWEYIRKKITDLEQSYIVHCGDQRVCRVILNFRGVSFIDATAVQGLYESVLEYRAKNVEVYIAGAVGNVRVICERVIGPIVVQKDWIVGIEAVVREIQGCLLEAGLHRVPEGEIIPESPATFSKLKSWGLFGDKKFSAVELAAPLLQEGGQAREAIESLAAQKIQRWWRVQMYTYRGDPLRTVRWAMHGDLRKQMVKDGSMLSLTELGRIGRQARGEPLMLASFSSSEDGHRQLVPAFPYGRLGEEGEAGGKTE